MINPKSISTIGIGFGSISISTIGFIFQEQFPIVEIPERLINRPNFLSPTGFYLMFNNFPALSLRCKNIIIPKLESNVATYETPLLNIPIIGNKLHGIDISCEIFMDENFESYNQIKTFFDSSHLPYESIEDFFRSYRKIITSKSIVTDCILTVFTNNNNANIEIRFIDIYPVSITDINQSSMVDDIVPVTFQCSFVASHVKINKNNT